MPPMERLWQAQDIAAVGAFLAGPDGGLGGREGRAANGGNSPE